MFNVVEDLYLANRNRHLAITQNLQQQGERSKAKLIKFFGQGQYHHGQTLAKRSKKLYRMFKPTSNFRYWWNFIWLLILLYLFIVIPVRIGFIFGM